MEGPQTRYAIRRDPDGSVALVVIHEGQQLFAIEGLPEVGLASAIATNLVVKFAEIAASAVGESATGASALLARLSVVGKPS
jgi:hypothetical protein